MNTTLSGPAGYVLVWVSMQPDRASTALHTRAREIGRQTAGVAFGLI